jgi:MFS family permease
MTKDQSPAARKPWRFFFWTGLFFLILTFAPLISALLAGWIASILDCQVNEAWASSCVLFGKDIGDTLLTMFVMGWFMFYTIILLPIALILFLIALVLRWRGRRKSKEHARD